MEQSILDNRYDLQYVLYLLALHRQLKARLADYDYDRHMGGALYLFLRGTRRRARACIRPSATGLDRALDDLFQGASPAHPANRENCELDLRDFLGPLAAKAATGAERANCSAAHALGRTRLAARVGQAWPPSFAPGPRADPLLILAAALTSHQLGRGHACLDLQAALLEPTAPGAAAGRRSDGEAQCRQRRRRSCSRRDAGALDRGLRRRTRLVGDGL